MPTLFANTIYRCASLLVPTRGTAEHDFASAAVNGGGIHAHTKTSEGFVRHIGNNITNRQLAKETRWEDLCMVVCLV